MLWLFVDDPTIATPELLSRAKAAGYGGLWLGPWKTDLAVLAKPAALCRQRNMRLMLSLFPLAGSPARLRDAAEKVPVKSVGQPAAIAAEVFQLDSPPDQAVLAGKIRLAPAAHPYNSVQLRRDRLLAGMSEYQQYLWRFVLEGENDGSGFCWVATAGHKKHLQERRRLKAPGTIEVPFNTYDLAGPLTLYFNRGGGNQVVWLSQSEIVPVAAGASAAEPAAEFCGVCYANLQRYSFPPIEELVASLKPDALMIWLDEIRIAGHEQPDPRGTGAALADWIRRAAAAVRRETDAPLMILSDMIDPFHNAGPETHYPIRGSFYGSFDGLHGLPEITVGHWNTGTSAAAREAQQRSKRFFRDRGHPLLLMFHNDNGDSRAAERFEAAAGGAYFTSRGDYSALESHAAQWQQ